MIKFVLTYKNLNAIMLRFDTVSEYNTFNNHETLHPLVMCVVKQKRNNSG